MPSTFDKAFAQVQELVATFRANEQYFQSAEFSEAETRKTFIDKFFFALGWDVNHDQQKNPYEQEVKIEKNEDGSQRRTDYAFFLKPNFHDVRFFVEAKKPHGDFGTPDNYFQTIRYGWPHGTPLAVLTNFNDFHILDCRYEPNIGDTLSRVVKRFTCDEYADSEKFAEIYWLFSREAVATNSLAKFADNLPQPKSRTFRTELYKRANQPPDESFLIKLDEYRETLAEAFKAKNPNLDGEQLTEVVQRTLDRLIFIRFLEDKLIEPKRRVECFGMDGRNTWEDFIAVALGLDRAYNGIVFKRHDILDAPGFQVDDKAFKRICEELSDPTSPYNFDAIPIHILGSIYERFLGKVIVATGRRARVEEKPEVRKAGGVYYTPEYIVRYIVENTVGKLIEGKTPAQIAEMKFADIACGSGSFLLGVFDLLLRYHARYYNKNPGKAKKDCIERDDGLHLSLQTKQEILQKNIYGVDMDHQAVEVAQLSLYLKLLEDETPASAHAFQTEFHYTLLPSLAQNIVCGNSLVGTDVLLTNKLTEEEQKKLNPMDFEDRFPQIFRRKSSGGELRETPASPMDWTMPGAPLHGGFNYKKSKKVKAASSPSLPVSEYEGGFDAIVGNPPYGAELKPLERAYLQKTYNVSITDTAALFILRQIQLLKPNAPGSFIVPKPLIYASNWKEVRSVLLPDLLELCDCSKVWPEVKLEQIIYRLQKGSKAKTYKSFNRNQQAFEYLGDLEKQLCERFEFILSNVSPAEVKLALKLKKSGRYMGEIIENRRGAMLQSKIHPTNGELRVIGGKQIGRYEPMKDWKGRISKKSATDENAFVGKNSVLVQNIVAHIAHPKDHIQLIATLLPPTQQKGSVILDTVNQLSVANPRPAAFVAGLLNSQLVNWFVYRFIFARAIRTMHFDSPITSRIPFPDMDLNRQADQSRCEQMVSLVEQMLGAKRQLAGARSDKDKIFYENKCAALDRQIDGLVYELYGLTEGEIKIVEGTDP